MPAPGTFVTGLPNSGAWGFLHTSDNVMRLYRNEAIAYCNGAGLIFHEVSATHTPANPWLAAKWNDVLPILLIMEHEGGHFASLLAKAWLRADIPHEAILRRDFAHLLDKYANVATVRSIR